MRKKDIIPPQSKSPEGIEENNSAPPDKLLTMDEICQFLGSGKTKVFELIHRHDLPVYKIGGVNRFDRQEVWQWLQQRRRRQSL